MNPSEKSGTLSLYVAGKHILEFDHKDEVIRYVEVNSRSCPQAPVMKREEFKKQTSKFVFKDDSRDYKCLNRVQKI